MPSSINSNVASPLPPTSADRKSTRLNSSHSQISYAVFCLKKKKITNAAGTEAYPISSFTWMLLYEDPQDKGMGRAMVAFLNWALADGHKYCAEFGTPSLPA